jgi:aquaporin Z
LRPDQNYVLPFITQPVGAQGLRLSFTFHAMSSAICRKPSTRSQLQTTRIAAYFCELVGVAIVLFNALSWACWNFGAGSPIVQWVPDRSLRLVFQAICIATGVTIVVYSPLGKRAGGHLNPAMTLGFWLLNKISTRDAVIYVSMQLLGALTGATLVRALFPNLFQSIRGGTTALGQGVYPAIGFGLEVLLSLALMLVVLAVVNSRWMRWTGIITAAMFVLLYTSAAPWTGASFNPARSLAPALLVMFWQYQWIYWTAPPLGAALAVFLYQQGTIGTGKSYCCKLYHPFDIPCHHRHCGYSDPLEVDDFSRR